MKLRKARRGLQEPASDRTPRRTAFSAYDKVLAISYFNSFATLRQRLKIATSSLRYHQREHARIVKIAGGYTKKGRLKERFFEKKLNKVRLQLVRAIEREEMLESALKLKEQRRR